MTAFNIFLNAEKHNLHSRANINNLTISFNFVLKNKLYLNQSSIPVFASLHIEFGFNLVYKQIVWISAFNKNGEEHFHRLISPKKLFFQNDCHYLISSR